MKKILFVILMFLSTSALALDLDVGLGTCHTTDPNLCDGEQLLFRVGQDLLPLKGEDTIRVEVQRYGNGNTFFDDNSQSINSVNIYFRMKLGK